MPLKVPANCPELAELFAAVKAPGARMSKAERAYLDAQHEYKILCEKYDRRQLELSTKQ